MPPATRNPLIDKRLRSVLFSVGICAALMAAYYMAVGRETVSPDTAIVWRGTDRRLEMAHDGAIVLTHSGTTYRYRIGGFAMRKVLRVFHRHRFLGLDAARFNRGACVLSLRQAGRVTALAYDCATPPPDIAGPLTAIRQATQLDEIIKNNNNILHKLEISHSPEAL